MGTWEMNTVQVHSCTVGRGVALQYITVSDREESEAASTTQGASGKKEILIWAPPLSLSPVPFLIRGSLVYCAELGILSQEDLSNKDKLSP